MVAADARDGHGAGHPDSLQNFAGAAGFHFPAVHEVSLEAPTTPDHTLT